MASSAGANLRNLEKQFAGIKALIPEVNEVRAGTLFVSQIARDCFRYYSVKWDQWENELSRKALLEGLKEDDGTFLSQKVLGMMQGLVLVRRYADEARAEQNRHKAHVLDLMKRLHAEVMKARPTGKLPSFSFPEVNPPVPPARADRPLKTRGLKRNEAKLLRNLFESFELKKVPPEAGNQFRRMLNDSLQLSHVGLQEAPKWEKRIETLEKGSLKVRAGQQARLADAMQSLAKMHRVRLQLEASCRELFAARHAKLIYDLQEFVTGYHAPAEPDS